jgi:hypothetical protein
MARIYEDPRTASRSLGHTLYAGGEPMVTSTLRAYSDPEAPAVVLEATLPWPADPTLVGLGARVVLRIGPLVRWVDYTGEIVSVSEQPDGTGLLVASTAGFYQGGDTAIRFNGNEPTEYSTTPQEALEDMLGRFPYTRVRVPNVRSPAFVRVGEQAYPIVADVGSAIADVEEAARLKQKDTFLNEAIVQRRPTVGSITAQEGSDIWHVGREVAEFSADPRADSRFFSVAMVQQNPITGEYARVVPEDAKIRYQKPHMAPSRGVVFYEEMTPETDPVTGAAIAGEFVDDARSLQAQIAISLGLGGEHSVQAVVPYVDPRIEDLDSRDIIKVNRETGVLTRWRTTIEAQERNYTENTATYTMAAIALYSRKPGEDSPDFPTFPDEAPPTSTPDEPEPPEALYPSDTLYPSETLVPQ